MSHKKLDAATRIIRKAAEAGSHAKTVAGALGYLRTHLPSPPAGLAHLRSPEAHPPVKAPCEHGAPSRKAGGAWSYGERAGRRAKALVEKLIKMAPARPFSALARHKGRAWPWTSWSALSAYSARPLPGTSPSIS